MVTKIQNNDISEVEKSGLAVVDFSATWCGPCKMLAPIFHELAEEMEGIAFFNADVDENGELAEKYGIQGVPTVLVFKEGAQEDRSVGFQPKDKLRQFIEAHRN
ncbi:MAG: thioredoxin [Butyrivibrio sp.]|nr:thioredoxin [Acetatifactor muris]MCM1561148.1 thioredoxin [Butyrivibrio sp.]